MRKTLALILPSLVLALVPAPAAPADPPAAPDGWTAARAGADTVYTPGDLGAGETYRVTLFPPAALNGLTLGDALGRFTGRDVATLGAAAGTPGRVAMDSVPADVVQGAHQVRTFTAAGRTEAAAYFAFSADGRRLTVARAVFDTAALLTRYQPGLTALLKSTALSLARAAPPEAPPAAPPSGADKAAQAGAARREAERYKFVTTPDRGVQDGQIAGVVMHFESGVYDPIMNIDHSTRTVYLLLKDGTYHEGLPVAPCVLDAALSRRREPAAWGSWRRAAEPGFLTLTSGAPPRRTVTFEALPLLAARPADLQGHYGRATFSGSILGGGSATQWGVAFGAGDRFRTDSGFSFSNGAVAQAGPSAPVMVFGGSDGGGTYVSASGGGATVTGAQRKAGQAGATTGTYALRGYSLILHYDDGVTEYTPCYFETPDRMGLHFRGGLLFRGS